MQRRRRGGKRRARCFLITSEARDPTSLSVGHTVQSRFWGSTKHLAVVREAPGADKGYVVER